MVQWDMMVHTWDSHGQSHLSYLVQWDIVGLHWDSGFPWTILLVLWYSGIPNWVHWILMANLDMSVHESLVTDHSVVFQMTKMTSQQWAHDCFHSNHIVKSAKTIEACFLWARGWGMEWRQTSKGENGMKAGEWNEDMEVANGLNAGPLYSRDTCKIRSLFFFTALTVALQSPILHSRTKS